MQNLVFLGPPGAGKGTQAQALAERRGLPHVSTGDLFRAAIAEGTALGLEAKGFMDKGLLVPDEVVCGMVRETLEGPKAGQGFILDGFPRTTAQAEALDRDLAELKRPITAVISLTLSDETVLERLGGRLTCKCGAMYHKVHNPPAKQDICDSCGGELYIRPDDQAETIKRRLEEYKAKTAPLVDYYSKAGLLREVPADGGIADVQAALERVLGDG